MESFFKLNGSNLAKNRREALKIEHSTAIHRPSFDYDSDFLCCTLGNPQAQVFIFILVSNHWLQPFTSTTSENGLLFRSLPNCSFFVWQLLSQYLGAVFISALQILPFLYLQT